MFKKSRLFYLIRFRGKPVKSPIHRFSPSPVRQNISTSLRALFSLPALRHREIRIIIHFEYHPVLAGQLIQVLLV